MPRPRHAQGRPGTQVIPTDWDTSHRPVLDRTRRGRITLRKPGGTPGGWDEATQQTTTVPHPPYAADQPCRVLALTAQTTDSAEDAVTVAGYRITLDAALEPAVGHLGVLAATGDPLLDGRTVRVTEVVLGTERFERVILADLND